MEEDAKQRLLIICSFLLASGVLLSGKIPILFFKGHLGIYCFGFSVSGSTFHLYILFLNVSLSRICSCFTAFYL